MSLTLFTAAGCARCNIAKKFMQEKCIAYDEHDAVGEGKECFGQFYRTHRQAVVRVALEARRKAGSGPAVTDVAVSVQSPDPPAEAVAC